MFWSTFVPKRTLTVGAGPKKKKSFLDKDPVEATTLVSVSFKMLIRFTDGRQSLTQKEFSQIFRRTTNPLLLRSARDSRTAAAETTPTSFQTHFQEMSLGSNKVWFVLKFFRRLKLLTLFGLIYSCCSLLVYPN